MLNEAEQKELLEILRPLYHSVKGDYNKWKRGKGQLSKVEAQEKLKTLFPKLEASLIPSNNG